MNITKYPRDQCFATLITRDNATMCGMEYVIFIYIYIYILCITSTTREGVDQYIITKMNNFNVPINFNTYNKITSM